MKIFLAVIAALLIIPAAAQGAAVKFDPQADANANGGWSSAPDIATPQRTQEFSECELYQFYVPVATPRSGGGWNYTYSRVKNGSGVGCYGYWPGVPAGTPSICQTYMESATVRVFKTCSGYYLRAKRVWWQQYGGRQKGIQWMNNSTVSWLIGTMQWYA